MDERVKGIILKAIDYKESDKLLTILTLEKGKILVRARGVKKPNSKFKAFCQCFCFADFELINGKAGYILAGVNCIDSFFDIVTDFDKFSYASSVLEILDKICVENQVYYDLFLSAVKCINTINYSNENNSEINLCKFIIEVLSLEGFTFDLATCSECGGELKRAFLDLSTGEIVCACCNKSEQNLEISNGVLSAIKILVENDYNRLSSIKFSKQILTNLLAVLYKNLAFRFEIKINSLKYSRK